jgi:hypothetical protein
MVGKREVMGRNVRGRGTKVLEQLVNKDHDWSEKCIVVRFQSTSTRDGCARTWAEEA